MIAKGSSEMLRKARTVYLQEPLFEELKRYICYVCHRWIKKDGLNVGNGVWRHAKCKPIEHIRRGIVNKTGI